MIASGKCRLLAFVLLWLPLAVIAEEEVLPDRSGMQVLTPSLSGRQTAKMRLANGLEVYLISDPGATQSAAALRVDVGCFQDPVTRPGTAHFIEHMLFLGTERYPEEGGFRKFVEDHAGSTNAATTNAFTMYMFSVNSDVLPEALDRFAHFFIDPLLTSSAIGREQRAIHQEFERAVENDGWRQHMVLKALGSADHPFSRFGAGNSKTLEGITSEEARQWYASHYSANIMHLVVYSPLSLEELQALIVQDFREIPDRHVEPFYERGAKVDPEQKGKVVYITPHKSVRNLVLQWELPVDGKRERETHASRLIASVLGHQGPGSLFAQLRQEGLAEDIECGGFHEVGPNWRFSDIYLSIDLTQKGVKERFAVVERVYQAIERLREGGIPEYVHQERTALIARKYEFQTREDPYKVVSKLIRKIGDEELETFPRQTLLPSRYDVEAVADILEQMTPQNAQLVVTAAPSETRMKVTQKEPWMGASYEVRELPSDLLTAWSSVQAHPQIVVPPPNPYIPEQLAVLYSGPCMRCSTAPQLLSDDHRLKLYYAQDRQYLVPELAWDLRIKSVAVRPGSAEEAVLNDLFILSVQEALYQEGHQAARAGLHYSLGSAEHGVRLVLSGYNDKAPLLLRRVLSTLSNNLATEEQFLLMKEQLVCEYGNAAKCSPVDQALEMVSRVLRRDYVTASERARALRRVDYGRFARFCREFTRETFCEVVLFGNLSEYQARDVGELIVCELHSQGSAECRDWKQAIVRLPEEGGPFYLEKKTGVRGNAIVLAVQEGPFSFKRRAAQQLLALGMETPFFVTLRTEQQTGYLVQSWDQEIERQLFGFFAVQSSSHDGRDLLARFELMIETFLRDLRASQLPQKRFEEMKQALVERLSEPPRNPQEMVLMLATCAFAYDGDFDWHKRRAEAVRELTYDEFEAFSREFLGKNNKQRMAVLVEGKLPGSDALQYHKVRSPMRMKQLADFVSRD